MLYNNDIPNYLIKMHSISRGRNDLLILNLYAIFSFVLCEYNTTISNLFNYKRKFLKYKNFAIVKIYFFASRKLLIHYSAQQGNSEKLNIHFIYWSKEADKTQFFCDIKKGTE